MLPRCLSVHPSARTIVTGIAPAAAPLRQFFMRFPLQSPLLQIAHLHRIRQRLTPPLPSAGSHEKCDRIFRGFPPTGGGSRSAGIGATVPVSQTANSHFCNCHHSRNRTAPSPCGGGMGWGSAMLPRCFSVHPSARIIITGIAPAFSPIYKAFLQCPLLQMTNLHRIRQRLTPPLPSPVGGGSRSAGKQATVPASQTTNEHFCNCRHSRNRTVPSPAGRASVRSGTGIARA